MKVTYGLKKLAYAKITISSEGVITYSNPVMLPGAREMSLSPVGEDVAVYADDIAYVTITSNQGYEGDLTLLNVPETFMTEIMGMTKDTNGVVVENAEDAKESFALLGEFSSETAEFTLPITCSPAVDTGAVKATVVGGVIANTAFDGWYTAVYLSAEG